MSARISRSCLVAGALAERSTAKLPVQNSLNERADQPIVVSGCVSAQLHALRYRVALLASARQHDRKPWGAARATANLKVGVIRWARSRAHVNIELRRLRELATQRRRHLLIQASIELVFRAGLPWRDDVERHCSQFVPK